MNPTRGGGNWPEKWENSAKHGEVDMSALGQEHYLFVFVSVKLLERHRRGGHLVQIQTSGKLLLKDLDKATLP